MLSLNVRPSRYQTRNAQATDAARGNHLHRRGTRHGKIALAHKEKNGAEEKEKLFKTRGEVMAASSLSTTEEGYEKNPRFVE